MNSKILVVAACTAILQAMASTGLRYQLEEVNSYWKLKNKNDQSLNLAPFLHDETFLIKKHLSLVENELRNKDIKHLSLQQRNNRLKCLDILHNYWTQGVFPKNLDHKKRTPYFIDKYGTACAVGQMIISTGYSAFAKEISAKHNNAYISELANIYSEIATWAFTFGFTEAELAWIQPCYCVASGPATINPACPGGFTGYFMPDISNLPAPCSFYSSRWNGTTWFPKMFNCAQCDLNAGSYKMTVKDGTGEIHEFFATLYDPPTATITVLTSGNYLNCNGTATATIIGGTPPYSFTYPAAPSVSNVATQLCQQSYRVLVNDSKNCTYETIFTLGNPTSLDESSYETSEIFPNPTSGSLTIRLPSFSQAGRTTVLIYDVTGHCHIQYYMDSQESILDLAKLPQGVYFLRVQNENKVFSGKFVKEE